MNEIIALFCRFLEVDSLGPDDNFFDMGGDSQLAEQVMAALEPQYGPELPVALLLDFPTARDLAEALAERFPAK